MRERSFKLYIIILKELLQKYNNIMKESNYLKNYLTKRKNSNIFDKYANDCEKYSSQQHILKHDLICFAYANV